MLILRAMGLLRPLSSRWGTLSNERLRLANYYTRIVEKMEVDMEMLQVTLQYTGKHESQVDHSKGFGGKFGVQVSLLPR